MHLYRGVLGVLQCDDCGHEAADPIDPCLVERSGWTFRWDAKRRLRRYSCPVCSSVNAILAEEAVAV